MGKRANNQTVTKSSKKVKTDPVLKAVGDVIKEADHLPEQCRAMLVDMLPFSLSVPSDERHETQVWAVNTVEQTLLAKEAALEALVAAEDAKLASLKSSEDDLVNAVKASEANLDAQKEVVQREGRSLAEAKEAASTAENALLALQTEQKTGETTLASTQEQKSAIEQAFEAHYNARMQEGFGPNFNELQPFLQKIEMETSFLNALPSSCSKSKADRGSFDDVVLQELEKALSSQIAALATTIEAETAAIAQRAAAIEVADEDHKGKKDAEQRSADAFEAAEKEQHHREALLAKAKSAAEDFQPQVDAMTGLANNAKTALAKFQSGPLTNFTAYKTRVADAAAAGA